MEYEEALREVRAWHLGKTSERHETGGRGLSTISTGKGDRGGKSYGAYQLSTNVGTLQEYLEQSTLRHQFAGIAPGSAEFDAKWRELAREEPEAFRRDQHDFIGRTHYEPQLARLDARGIHLRDRGIAVQDALWSTSVQFRGLTTTIVAKGIEEKFGEEVDPNTLTDRQIIDAMQDYKIAHNNRLFRSSPSLWPGLLARAAEERDELLRLERQEAIVRAGSAPEAADDLGLLSAPNHPHNPVYTRTLNALHAAESARDIPPGPHSERLAAALTVSALEAGIARVDRVELNDRGTLARVIQASPIRDEPGLNLTSRPVDTAAASRQPLQETSELARALSPVHAIDAEPQALRTQQALAQSLPPHTPDALAT